MALPPAPQTEKTVEITIGHRMPSRGWKAGDKVKVTEQEAASFRSRGMLQEQVQIASGNKKAKVDAVQAEKESLSGEMHRRLIRDLEAKLLASRQENIRLTKDNGDLTASLKEATKAAEDAKAALLRAKDDK